MPSNHHQLSGHELGQTPGDSEGQGGLPGLLQSMGRKESEQDLATEQVLSPFISITQMDPQPSFSPSYSVFSIPSVHLALP